MPYLLNGFAIRLSADSFKIQVRAVPDPAQMKALRAQYGHDWFISWRGGYAYGIPKGDEVDTQFGKNRVAECQNHDFMHLISARLSNVLPHRFPKYKAFSRRPFAFLGQKEEIVGSVIGGWRGVNDLVREFKIRPRYELDPRIIELRPDETEIAVFLKIGLNWSILASLEDLQTAQIELAGLNVVRRDPGPDERRLVGTIAVLQDGNVQLSESFDDLKVIEAKRVQLEGSKASFTRCLRKLLGSRYQEFDEGRYRAEGEYLLGPSLHRFLEKMQGVLKAGEKISLAPDLSCEISDIVEARNEPQYRTVVSCGSVQYCFDAAKVKRHELAWSGLTKFGPFDRETFSKRTPRILVVCPNESAGKVSQFIRLFRDGIQSEANSRFAKGFSGTFGLVNPQFVTCEVPTLGKSEGRAGETYWRTIENHLAATDVQYDLALVVILDQHSRLSDLNSPYLRGKAVLLANGIPVQDVRLNTITARPASLQYTLQNLSVAMYAKMGGTPWTVSHDLTVDDEVVIGMGNFELTGSRFDKKQRFMGITTVFRGDGNYLLSNVSRVCRYEDYAAELETSMIEVLREVKRRNGWQRGDTVRVVLHAHKPLRNVEVAQIVRKCISDIGSEQTIQFAFLTVTHDHPFKILDTAQKGKEVNDVWKGVYAPDRGTVIQLGRYTRLLVTNGLSQIKRASAPLPTPLLVNLHRESTYVDLQYLPEQVLKFTSLTWRSTQPAHAPVTIYYSELIASLLSRLKEIPGWSPAVLNTKLKSSRWFL